MKPAKKTWALLALFGALGLNMSWLQQGFEALNSTHLSSNRPTKLFVTDCEDVANQDFSSDRLTAKERKTGDSVSVQVHYKLIRQVCKLDPRWHSTEGEDEQLTEVYKVEYTAAGFCGHGPCKTEEFDELPDLEKLSAEAARIANAALEEKQDEWKEAREEELLEERLEKLQRRVENCTHRWKDVDTEERFDPENSDVDLAWIDGKSDSKIQKKIASGSKEQMSCLAQRLGDDDELDDAEFFQKKMFKKLDAMVREGDSATRADAISILEDIYSNDELSSKLRSYVDAMLDFADSNEQIAQATQMYLAGQLPLNTYQSFLRQMGTNAQYQLRASGDFNNPLYQDWYNQLAYRIQALSANPEVGRGMFGTNFTGTIANLGMGIYGGNPLPTDRGRVYDRQNPRGNADYYRDTFSNTNDFLGTQQRMTRTSLNGGLPGQRQQGPVRTSQRRR